MVNEDEYSDIVRKRQEEDWVVDDGMETSLLAYGTGALQTRIHTGFHCFTEISQIIQKL